MYNLHFQSYLVSATFCVELQIRHCIKTKEGAYVCVHVCACLLYRNPRWKCNAETRHDNVPSAWEGARGSVLDCLSRKAAWAAFVSEVV